MTDMVARLDDLGLPAWIAVMVLGFIVFWPVGLLILAYLIWSGRMGCGGHRRDFGRWQQRMSERFERGMSAWGQGGGGAYAASFPRTGNHAFDEYREATLRRLEEEAHEFTSFLERLRMAKDRSEFDQFMAERKSRGANSNGDPGRAPDTGTPPQT
jgi:hypothetical protein